MIHDLPAEKRRRLDVAYSHRVAEEIGAQPKQCWSYAVTALQTVAELQRDKARYVEGSVVWSDYHLPLEHGWLELPDGRIVDPTAVVSVPAGTHPQVVYFPAIRYDLEEVRWHADREAEPQLVDYTAPDEEPEPRNLGRRWRNPAYLIAYQAALREAVTQQGSRASMQQYGRSPLADPRTALERFIRRHPDNDNDNDDDGDQTNTTND